jgi:acyl-coenzyme A synthetase/AMP-(fatty) acid ligase/aryl carrier-like protein
MINHLEAFIDVMGLDANDVVAQTASAGFDISVWQFLAALAVGGKTVVIDTAVVLDTVQFLRSLDEGGVTVFQSVPSLLTAFLHDLPVGYASFLKKVRWLLMTGEALGVGLVGEWYARYPAIKMLNVYGPTEASDDITTYVVAPPEDGQQSIPIGRPIQNMQIYILDDQLRVCPEGVKGEICVAGIGVGKGYWRDEEKTKKVFIPNTVSVEPIDPDHRTIYKTGDLGYYQPDGNIVCLGRKDDQVKIRGFRIEPGEIEARLMMHEAVKGAVVLAMEKRGQKYLVAYFIGDGDVKYSELRNFLSAGLPEYMIPAFFVRMESFPVTSNGKLDKKALPMPEVEAEAAFVAPTGAAEEALVAVWAELLEVRKEEISVTRNFFELGGNSLLILKLRSILNKTQGWNLSISDLFRYPTIASLVESIAQAADSRMEYDREAQEEVSEMEAFLNVLE